MAFNSLVAGECGGANPLMKLTEHVHNHSHSERTVDQYKKENGLSNIAIPQTFNMQNLLDEMQDLQRPVGMANISHVENTARDWQQDYTSQYHPKMITPKPDVRLKEVRSANVDNRFNHFQPSYQPVFRPPPSISMQRNSQQNWAHQFLDDSLKEVEHRDREEEKTGKEILESLEVECDLSKQWVDEFSKEESVITQTQNENEEEEDEDYLNSIPDVTDADVEYWEKLQKDFDELFKNESLMNNEELSLNSPVSEKEYSFEDSNPFSGHKNPFEEGVKKLNEGDLISAILLFEEAVTQEPEHAEAWQYLGTSQAENEQEFLSIKALNKCVELQPDNLEAWMALSVSYTNESMYLQACQSLKSWIKNNPKYENILSNQLIPTGDLKAEARSNTLSSSLVSTETLKEVENIFLTAARLSPQQTIDPQIQIGLGILFNISHEYEKAIDCFKTGLQVKPDSALLWNKLGATLANSGKSAEAIEAYRNALSLRPGFIRCRYNLGISCINLKAYDTAIEHFLSALNMQRQGEDPTRTASTMSENIWDTLRMTMSLHGRSDLLKAVEKRDLGVINREMKTR